MWFVYIIENKLGHFYTGICKDLNRRFEEHNSNGPKCAKALKGKGPLRLIYCCQIADHSSALKMELWIKKLSKMDKNDFVNERLRSPFVITECTFPIIKCPVPHNKVPAAI